MRFGICLLVLVGLCVCVGCGGDPGVKGLVKVTGTVTYQGSPMEGATVRLSPTAEAARPAVEPTPVGSFS